MKMLFFVAMCWFFAYMNSAYHPDLLFNKHIIVENKILQRLLISRSNPINVRWYKNREEYQDKLLISGIVFYAISLAFAVNAPLFLIYGPQTLTGKVYSSGTPQRMCEAILEYAFWFFIMVELLFNYINTVARQVRIEHRKWLVVIYYITGAYMVLMLVFIGYELVSTILGAF